MLAMQPIESIRDGIAYEIYEIFLRGPHQECIPILSSDDRSTSSLFRCEAKRGFGR